jgi:hypothetical protein
MPPEVAAAFDAFPDEARKRLLETRALIFETAAKLKGVGPLTETLKWGEPAYLTEGTGSGSTIRLGMLKSAEGKCAVLFNCRTNLVESFRERFPGAFRYEKNRAVILPASSRLPHAALATCLAMALTYHQARKRR